MKRRIRKLSCFVFVIVIVIALTISSAAFADKVITGVPDWNQPDSYASSTAGMSAGDYPDWCSPTSGASLMGYWEDVKGFTGLADGMVFSASPTYPANNGTWQQGKWHDGTIEMGWYMDTGKWQSMSRPFPPGVGATTTSDIGPGVVAYASDAGYTATTSFDVWDGTMPSVAAMWSNYLVNIDSDLPVLCSFEPWVGTLIGSVIVDGQSVDKYNFADTGTLGHTVVGVGYIDPDPSALHGDEFFITQDNWGTTVQYVAVPVNNLNWRQNDYVSIPEPFTLVLLTAGIPLLIKRKRR